MAHAIVISGEYSYVLGRLFTIDVSGHAVCGAATSMDAIGSLDKLSLGVMFRDYIMEGGTRYWLRTSSVDDGLRLEIELLGTSRDQYVILSIHDYIKWAGLCASSEAPPNTSLERTRDR